MTSLPSVPPLADDEIHLWHGPWAGGAGEARFAELLASYAGPGAPAIARAEHGKPYFPAPFDTLGFSWSHSGDVAVLAVGRGPVGFQVGVDIETIRPRARALELSRRFFAATETAWLESLPAADVLNGFLSLWTAKEAVLKAHGGGLSYGLHRVAFEIGDGRARPATFDGEVSPASAWQVHPLELAGDQVAAVAWRGCERAIRVFTSPL